MKNFNTIYNQFNAQILNFVSSMIFDRSIAEEITQDVFMKVFNNLNTFDQNKSSLKTWIYNIAKNSCIDYIRTAKKESQLQTTSINNFQDEEGNVFVKAVENRSADRNVLANELGQRLTIEMAKLSDSSKQIFELRFIEGLKLSEIATQLNIPLNTVKVTVMRAKNELQANLTDLRIA